MQTTMTQENHIMRLRRIKPRYWIATVPALFLLASGWGSGVQAQVATQALVSGEIEQITINPPATTYSGGTMVVGGQIVILPANLLIDLPANRRTLQQLFQEAPANCVAVSQTGLAKGDSCNTSGVGAFATIAANRTSAGNVIAGDVLIEKGKEVVAGNVTFINHTDGYLRINGNAGVDTGGVVVRINDPSGRHTVQQGLGCLPGAQNCSADPRFTLDADNYTNVFTTGYPVCIASTVTGVGARTVGSDGNGVGDPLCPTTNRPGGPGVTTTSPDSTHFAPILVGDNLSAEGNFETINGVRFLSAHTTKVSVAVTTLPNQPDYLFIDEAFIDAPGFQNARARALFIGFTTLAPADVKLWTLHRDPQTNTTHEFPLGSTLGCDAVGGALSCTGQGIIPGGGDIFRIRYDIDFVKAIATQKPDLLPCKVLRGDPLFASVCPGGGDNTVAGNFAVLSPMPHEIMFRTGNKLANPGLTTLDIQGNIATNGEYLFPFGIGLGGIDIPNFFEISLAGVQTPYLFSGIPWNLDRRLSPGGCDGACEGTPQPLTPFPFEILDPRTQEPTLPSGSYSDPTFTASTLTNVRNRILSFVAPGGTNFNGNTTVLAWPPTNPAFIPIATTPLTVPCAAGGGGGVNQPVTAVNDTVSTPQDVAVNINVLSNDTGLFNPATLAIASAPVPSGSGIPVPNPNGSITFTPSAGFSGTSTFTYTVQDQLGAVSNQATVTVNVVPFGPGGGNAAPVAFSDAAATNDNTPVTINILANDTDNGVAVVPAAVTIQVGPPAIGSVTINPNNTVTYTPVLGTQGNVDFTYTINDGLTTSNLATVTVAVTRVNVAPVLAPIAGQTVAAGDSLSVLASASDSPGDTLTFALTTAPAGMTINPATGLIAWTPTTAQVGANQLVTVRVTDQGNLSTTASFTVSVTAGAVRVTLAQFRNATSRWTITGASSVPGATITIFNSANLTGAALGTARANAAGAWTFSLRTTTRVPNAARRISVRSNTGATARNYPVTIVP
jgi:hypothetical protein